ncbi:hypothetical protein AM493_09230 [Flavobacterium akiainvivens]|uniref:DUF4199 domain-containing protein n=1 Tax=Flavobacterium akiainvivens TaxID=1202724 RepID=A0A0M8MH91_9FLAO|nr:DUF4199 domain-containing protein [Flavobacterium akiainvivens]KOS06191.1 hypothetical protein AM493_09230 [Flavobacterium akiainvivens]SFQ68419.1 Protein of unknown function [Flavobacterium akiainvivens]
MNTLVKKNGITFGIAIGLLSIFIYTLYYIVDLELFVNFWIGIILFLVNLGVGIFAVAKTKKDLGGYISFKEAFTTFFIVFAIGVAITTIFSIILFNFIDPAAAEAIKEHLIDFSANMMAKTNAPASEIKKTIDAIKENDSYSIKNQLFGYIWSLLTYTVIGLIVAAAMKKNNEAYK